MVHKDQHIEIIVKAIQPETPGYWSVIFERPVGFVFEAGDWLDLEFAIGKLSGGYTYSVASSPTEPDIMITFREGLSPFKKALRAVQPGDKLYIIQYGNDYGFQLKNNRSSILIAGGVGIAPFRSMLKEMYDTKTRNDVRLIYLNQNDNYLFRDELEIWSRGLPNILIDYIATKDISRKKREKNLKTLVSNIDQHFYIAGPPGMVESTQKFLEGIGVKPRNIKADIFGGY
jgi:ferredoxin-NADP reductase